MVVTKPNRARANTSQVMLATNARRDQVEKDIIAQRAEEPEDSGWALESHQSASLRSHKAFLMGMREQIMEIGRLSTLSIS